MEMPRQYRVLVEAVREDKLSLGSSFTTLAQWQHLAGALKYVYLNHSLEVSFPCLFVSMSQFA